MRLQRKYLMLREMLREGRAQMAKRDPFMDAVAPPADVYLSALDIETATKTLDEMHDFLNQELAKAMAGVGPEHPLKRELQADYVKELPAIIDKTCALIAEGRSFDGILEVLARERRYLAAEYAHHPIDKFGVPRIDTTRLFRTSFTRIGRYKAYLDRVMAMVPDGARDFRPPATFDVNVGMQWLPALEGVTVWEDGIPLTTILVCRQHQDDGMFEWLFGDNTTPYPSAAMVHTDVDFVPILRDRCRALFERLRKGDHGSEELIAGIAELQWWLAHVMLYNRGSASIAEWLVAALFRSQGYRVTWSSQPDLEALLTLHSKDFAARYLDFSQIEGK